jgi:acyl-CoA thioesterase II
MIGNLARDTAVEGAEGRYTGHLTEQWSVWMPHGGFSIAVALRAVESESRFTMPMSLACHFLGVPEFGPIDILVSSLRKSRTAESLRVSISQSENPVLELMAWTGDPKPGFEHRDGAMPEVPAPDELKSTDQIEGALAEQPFWANLEQRSVDGVHWQQPESGPPRQRDWLRFRDFDEYESPFLNAARAVILLDSYAWPAAAHAHVRQPEFIAPTLALSAEFHAGRFGEWLLSDAYAPVASEGRISFYNRLWTLQGSLVASASGTLLCRPRPGYRK